MPGSTVFAAAATSAAAAAASAAAHAAAIADGADAITLFNGDYSTASVALELLKFFIFYFSGVLGGIAGGAGGALFIPVLLVLFSLCVAHSFHPPLPNCH